MTNSRAPHIVLLDLYSTGHHRSYLEMLVDFWVETSPRGRLTLFVGQEFGNAHPDFSARVESLDEYGIYVCPIDTDFDSAASGVTGLLRASREHAHAARLALDQSAPDHLVLMYLDHAQLAVPTIGRTAVVQGASISGIYFRPTFHLEPDGLRGRWVSLRKSLIMRRMVRSPGLHRVFCLDPYVVERINSWTRPTRHVAVHLPDGITSPDPARGRNAQRERWACAEDDIVMLFFGAVSRRKGIFTLFDALGMVDEPSRRRLVLIIAGSIPDSEQMEIRAGIRSLPGDLRRVVDDRYLDDAEMAACFSACDIVLAPYVGHVGSSNVVIRAAAANRPVIGPESGLVGRMIRDHELGASVDTSNPAELALALSDGARKPSALFDSRRARSFAEANRASVFARTFFSSLHPDIEPPTPRAAVDES